MTGTKNFFSYGSGQLLSQEFRYILLSDFPLQEGRIIWNSFFNLSKQKSLSFQKVLLLKIRFKFLGYNVEKRKVHPGYVNSEVIKKLRAPINIKDLQYILGIISLLQIYPNYAKLRYVLNTLLWKMVMYCEMSRKFWIIEKCLNL